MYTFSNRLKLASLILIILGAIFVMTGFSQSHKSFSEVETMLSHESTGHGGHQTVHENQSISSHSEKSHSTTAHAKDHSNGVEGHHNAHKEHIEHVQHQIANRPWSAIYVAAFFFFMIALGVLAFYAIQFAAQAGWSPVLFRVMEGITSYVLPGGLIVLLIAALSHYVGHDSLFVWMNPDMVNPNNEHFDALVAGKKAWLNVPWFLIRGLFFLGGWSLYRHFSRKFSLAQDEAKDDKNFKKSFRISAGLQVCLLVELQ